MEKLTQGKLAGLLSIAVVAVTVLAYYNSLGNGFVWDDRNLILESPFVHSIAHWQKLFTHTIGYSGGARNNSYRPVYSKKLLVISFIAYGSKKIQIELGGVA